MSSIDKLTLQGIRAFDSKQTESITFGTPLTLIVGHNGAGKTTIIEALKYATTGMFPPTSRGPGQQASFLHDPNIDHERETTAQIRVKIRTAVGAVVTATRIMSVSKKADKLSFAVQSGSVQIERNGARETNSTTAKQLDAQVPRWLGVSTAVLDKVIFCHQDESLWPMSASKDLKTNFDMLFEIEKYSKAIVELTMLKNRQKSNLVGYKKDEERFKVDKDRGIETRKSLEKLRGEVQDLREEVKDLDEQIKHAKSQADEADTNRRRVAAIVGELTGERIKAKVKKESLDNLQQNLQELEDDTATLESMAAQYEQRTEEYKQSSDKSKQLLQTLQRSVEQARTRLSNEEREVGANEAQRLSHERQLVRRVKLIGELAERHDMRGFGGELSDHQVQVFIERITRMARESGAAAETASRESSEELQSIQKILDSINERRTTLSARKDNAKKLIQENERKIDRLQKEHDDIDADEGAKTIHQNILDDAEAELQSAKNLAQSANYDAAESQANAELARLHAADLTLEAELRKATESAQKNASLDVLKKDLSTRQQRLDTMVNAHKAKLSAIIGTSQPSDIKQRYDSTFTKAASTLQDAEKKRDGVGRELEQAEDKFTTTQSKISEHERAIKTAAEAISRVIATGPEGYHTEIEELEQSRDTIKGDADSFQVMMRYLDQCIKDAQNHKVCRTCTRALKDKDVEALKKSMEREKKKFDLATTNNDLAQVENDLKEAKAVGPHVETWERLTKTELPALRNTIQQLEQQRTAIVRRLEAEDEIVREHANAKRDIEAASKNVLAIATLHNEIIEIEKNLQEVIAKLEGSDAGRDLGSITEDRMQNRENESAARTRLKKVLDEKNKSDKLVNSLELELRDARGVLAAVVRQLADKIVKEEAIEELKTSNTTQRSVLKDCDQKLDSAMSELDEAKIKYDDASVRGRERDKQLQADASKVNDSLNQLNNFSEEIQGYIDSDGPGRLAKSQTAVKNLKEQIEKYQQERHDISAELQLIDERLRDHSETKRNIDENLRFRRDTEQLKLIKENIVELESHDAETELEQFDEERDRWSHEVKQLELAQGTKLGSLGAKNEQLESSLATYNTQYKDAASEYKKATVKVTITQACFKDLVSYGKALDNAIMKYHEVKMGEINRIIDELWRKTYQGTDVDTIFIESDADSNNKNHNYRVCMKKGPTVMDMRGRCSAGQKVLACIIIRLALAECFGVNCGLIALDEPTTNLDTENAQALAMALAELIRARRAQKNFQIIIITHDEEFLKFMTPSTYVDSYYRVSRTSKQKSHIEREQISYLMRH